MPIPIRPHPDTLIRLVLGQMLQEPLGTLTAVQRSWLTARLQTARPLTAHERTRLRPVVLAWAQTRLRPAQVARLVAQFEGERP